MAKEKIAKQGNDALIAELEKKYGLSVSDKKDVEVVPSGSYQIDAATNIGGYVKGKVVEIYGAESCGKSTIVLHAIAEFQKAISDKKVALFDYEHSFDKTYAEKLGVDVSKLLLYQPDNQEQGYDLLIGLVEKELLSLAVIDSHTSAIPKVIIDGEMSAATIGMQARNNSKFLGKIKGLLEKTKTALLAISQTRVNIGGMGDTNISTGGSAWKFYADMRFKIWKSLDKPNEANKTTLDVIKNKCAKPFGKAEFNIEWGEGIDNYLEIIDMGVECGIIKKSGSWFSLDSGEKLGQGAIAVKELFKSNEEFYKEIRDRVLSFDKSDVKEEAVAGIGLEEIIELTKNIIKEETDENKVEKNTH